jgi:hypothetical protein
VYIGYLTLVWRFDAVGIHHEGRRPEWLIFSHQNDKTVRLSVRPPVRTRLTLNGNFDFIFSSTCTNGFIIYTLTNHYKVHDRDELHNYDFHFYQVIVLFSTLKTDMVYLKYGESFQKSFTIFTLLCKFVDYK